MEAIAITWRFTVLRFFIWNLMRPLLHSHPLNDPWEYVISGRNHDFTTLQHSLATRSNSKNSRYHEVLLRPFRIFNDKLITLPVRYTVLMNMVHLHLTSLDSSISFGMK